MKRRLVQYFANQIGVVELSSDLSSGSLGEPIISDNFRIPTTVA